MDTATDYEVSYEFLDYTFDKQQNDRKSILFYVCLLDKQRMQFMDRRFSRLKLTYQLLMGLGVVSLSVFYL